jgi:hypothetical protein
MGRVKQIYPWAKKNVKKMDAWWGKREIERT